jgi:hypothetical protein
MHSTLSYIAICNLAIELVPCSYYAPWYYNTRACTNYVKISRFFHTHKKVTNEWRRSPLSMWGRVLT